MQRAQVAWAMAAREQEVWGEPVRGLSRMVAALALMEMTRPVSRLHRA